VYSAPPDDFVLDVITWLRNEVYPGLVGQPFDDRACAVWVAGARGYVAIWDGSHESDPRVRHTNAKHELFRRIEAVVHPPPPPPPGLIRPIMGSLRVQNGGWADDSGPRRIYGVSYFPAIRVAHDDPDDLRRQLDRCVGRAQMVRMFWHLATDYWVGAGRDVSPAKYPWFADAFRLVASECRLRDLCIHLTAGDLQLLSDHRRWFRWMADLVRSLGQPTRVALTEMVNEPYVNSTQGDDFAYWASLSRDWQAIAPWGQHLLGDPSGEEDPAAYLPASQAPATGVMIHGLRSPISNALGRAYSLVYDNRANHRTDKPFAQTEPTGLNAPGAEDVFQPAPDREWVFGLYTILAMTGQQTTYFSGPSVFGKVPLDGAWGFHELPQRWAEMELPEDVGQPGWRCLPAQKTDCPLRAESMADQGSGPERMDFVVSPGGALAFGVLYGGHDWRIRSRWTGRMQVYRASGLTLERDVADDGTRVLSLDGPQSVWVVKITR
jgi:hypothetical protein